jgi:hypothetical protein
VASEIWNYKPNTKNRTNLFLLGEPIVAPLLKTLVASYGTHNFFIVFTAIRTLIKIHSLFKRERLSANSKLTFHKGLIKWAINYAVVLPVTLTCIFRTVEICLSPNCTKKETCFHVVCSRTTHFIIWVRSRRNPLHQCCPTFLCTWAQFTDAYGGAGATTPLLLLRLLRLLLLNTTTSTTSTTNNNKNKKQ